MRRVLFALLLLPLFLAACAGGDTTVLPPPSATEYQPGGSAQVDAIIADWKQVAPEQMRLDAVKPETIEEKIYRSDATLEEIKAHYTELTTKGWYQSRRIGVAETGEVLLLGYENGVTSLVVGAIDASKLGGSGVVIYTLKGSK